MYEKIGNGCEKACCGTYEGVDPDGIGREYALVLEKVGNESGKAEQCRKEGMNRRRIRRNHTLVFEKVGYGRTKRKKAAEPVTATRSGSFLSGGTLRNHAESYEIARSRRD